jgi:hypothetical protein
MKKIFFRSSDFIKFLNQFDMKKNHDLAKNVLQLNIFIFILLLQFSILNDNLWRDFLPKKYVSSKNY